MNWLLRVGSLDNKEFIQRYRFDKKTFQAVVLKLREDFPQLEPNDRGWLIGWAHHRSPVFHTLMPVVGQPPSVGLTLFFANFFAKFGSWREARNLGRNLGVSGKIWAFCEYFTSI